MNQNEEKTIERDLKKFKEEGDDFVDHLYDEIDSMVESLNYSNPGNFFTNFKEYFFNSFYFGLLDENEREKIDKPNNYIDQLEDCLMNALQEADENEIISSLCENKTLEFKRAVAKQFVEMHIKDITTGDENWLDDVEKRVREQKEKEHEDDEEEEDEEDEDDEEIQNLRPKKKQKI